MKAHHRIYANPGNTVLAVVDMQNEFCKPGGVLFDEIGPKEMPRVLSTVKGLVEQARSVGIPVVYVQSVRTLQEPQFTVFGHRPILKAGAWNSEIVDELRPHPKDHVIQARHQDPFYKTRLSHLLEGLAPEPTRYQAILAGGAISGTLYLVAMGCYLRNYWTVVVVDAAYGDEEGMRFALGQFSKSSLPSVFLSRSDLVEFSAMSQPGVRGLTPST